MSFGVGKNPEDVRRARERLITRASLKSIIFMDQSHSSVVCEVDSQSFEVKADGIITQEKDVGLAVLAADCTPLLLKGSKYVGAVHVGRKGMELQIASRAIEMMRAGGEDRIEAIIGPAICGRCYEVSPQMYEEISGRIPASATSHEKRCLDIKSALKHELKSLNVNSHDVNICTLEDTHYFSHRRSLRDGEVEGRQVGVISL